MQTPILAFLVIVSAGVLLWSFVQRREANRTNGALQQQYESLQEALSTAQNQTSKIEEAHRLREQDHQQKEIRLRSYLELMDTLINTIPAPVYFKELQGVYQGCNRMFAKEILGLTRDRIIGTRPQDLPDQVPAELAALYQNQELKMVEKERMHTFEAQVHCADGLRRDFLFHLGPVKNREGGIDACVAVLSDLTEKNRAVQDRLQKEKLQSVLETAGAVCHELNQPLQALSGYVEILQVKLSANDDNTDTLEKIDAQIERMRDITDKLQGITRYETLNYADNTRIIDIHKASRKSPPLESKGNFK
jgi:PAS domain S-box-containing protein